MEAFIIEERVLTAEHMERSAKFERLKYVKKYDLPLKTAALKFRIGRKSHKK